MKLHKALIVPLSMFLSFGAHALEVTTSGTGTLNTLIDDNEITTLTVIGDIDASDIDFINHSLRNLETLDLGSATIKAYSGERVLTGGTEYAANELPAYSFMSMKLTSVTLPSTLETIGESALASTCITSVAIPASVTTIADHAFALSKLTSVTIPSTVTSMGANIFGNCKSLSVATIYSAAPVSDRMFEGCVSLGTANLSSSLKEIGNQAFQGCTALEDITFPASLTSIGNQAFYASGLESVDLRGCTSLDKIGDYAFALCSKLSTVGIGNNPVTLGQGVFFDDVALKKVTLPASTKIIPAFTFKGTESIDNKSALPAGVEKINEYAMTGWSNAKEFTLPAHLTYMGDNSMEGWESLDSIIGDNMEHVPQLGNDVFLGINQPDVDLFARIGMEDELNADPQWSKFHIVARTTGVDNIVGDMTNSTAAVDFAFEGTKLVISSKGENIATVTVYDLDGRRRLLKNFNTTVAEIETSTWGNAVYLAEVTLDDNTRTSVKISRN